MKIEIELTRGTAKRIGWVAVTLASLGVGAAVYASQTHFSSGQALTAASLNNNFDELYAATAKPAITRNGKSISTAGAYCGASATPVDGATVGGFTGAKATCEQACSSPTAHMCDTAEIIRSQQLGITFASQQLWIGSFTETNVEELNCQAWTHTFGYGYVWGLVPPRMDELACTNQFSIACCD